VLGDSIVFHDILDIVTKGIPPIYGKSLGMVDMVDPIAQVSAGLKTPPNSDSCNHTW